MPTMTELLDTLPQRGRVDWLGLRPERRAPIEVVREVEAVAEAGLAGDRYASKSGKRQVTLIQSEHLPVIASLTGRKSVEPELLRRNIVVSGINLLALKGKTFQVGEAILEYTGSCPPCSYMEEVFGAGGYNALRGHGGITARVLHSGSVRLQDEVFMIDTHYDA